MSEQADWTEADRAALAEVLYRSRVKYRGPVNNTTPEWDWASDVLDAGYRAPAPTQDRGTGEEGVS